MQWTVEDSAESVHRLVCSRKNGEERQLTIFVCSDAHFDSKECNRTLLKKHLDMAVEKNAAIIILGDWFDAMRSTGDRRMTHGTREGLDRLDYLDALMDESVTFLEPYKKNIALITQGNHESAMKRHHNTDLTRRLAVRLGVKHGPYRGFVIVGFTASEISTAKCSCSIYYDHGSGGAAPVTRGVIKTNRRAVMVPDADIVISGHIHERWTVEVLRIRVNYKSHRISYDRQIHASSGTYKQEPLDEGWAAEKGFGPPAVGGLWINLTPTKIVAGGRSVIHVATEIIHAH